MNTHKKFSVLHLFCGIGGGGLGFQRAGFETLAAIDNDPQACRDYRYLTGHEALCADLASLSPDDLKAICKGRRPDVVFTSPPCKGHSGCLPEELAQTPKYQHMNSLALHGIWLCLEAWPDSPPPLILLENVPRIQSRGRKWLKHLTSLLQSYGYAVTGSTHDCGEIGGLAQRRQRYLMVARHLDQVPELLHHPTNIGNRGVGDVLTHLPVPIARKVRRRDLHTIPGGPMHRLSALAAINWIRLALIPAGKDWRALPAQVALKARSARHNGGYGVNAWDAPSHAVVAHHDVANTWGSIADPRSQCKRREGSLGVTGWDARIAPIISHGTLHNGPWSVADPRLDCAPRAGVYGVQQWDDASPCVIAHARHDNGAWNIADPRPLVHTSCTIDVDDKSPTYIVIRALDGTWHRPLTTLELAALQGFPTHVNNAWLKLDGNAHARWRQGIGNAVPPPAAESIARSMMETLIASQNGSLHLSSTPVWVEPASTFAM